MLLANSPDNIVRIVAVDLTVNRIVVTDVVAVAEYPPKLIVISTISAVVVADKDLRLLSQRL